MVLWNQMEQRQVMNLSPPQTELSRSKSNVIGIDAELKLPVPGWLWPILHL